MRSVARSLALALLPLAPLSAQVTVPGSYPDPQTAVDSVAAGTTIVIQGGVWPSLTIDKAITLIGDPRPRFDPDHAPFAGIRLQGPGSGKVVLVNLETGGDVGFGGAFAGQGIAGGGFDELHVLESSIAAADFGLLTGLGYGGAGIDTDVPFLWIEESLVEGSRTDIDLTLTTSAPDAAPGVAAAGEVVVLDSTIRGGPNGLYTWGNQPEPCPLGCPAGGGSAAVECGTLYWANSFFVPGSGAIWQSPSGLLCCQVASPAPLAVTSEVPLRAGLFPASSPGLGDTLTLSWAFAIGPTWLITSPVVEPPRALPFGPWFLGPFGGVETTPVPSFGTTDVVVPMDPALIGMEFGVQVYDRVEGLSRPVAVVVGP